VSTALQKKISWCLYDFGNSAYTTVIVTVAYSVYFTEVVAKENGVILWGRGVAFSMLVVALLSPLLGSLADFSGRKRGFLVIFTLLAVFFTALLYFVEAGDVLYGLLFFVFANISYNIALIFYDAFLKDLADSDHIGRLSGYGWATGYIGGFVSLLVVFPLLKGGFAPASLPFYRLSFLVTAFFFLVFSLPIFIWVRDAFKPNLSISSGPDAARIAYLRSGFIRVGETLRDIRQFRALVLFFVAFFFYNDAINTIIAYSSIFAIKVLAFTPFQLILYFVITQISAAAGSFLFAPFTDRYGEKKIISICLILWIGIVIWAFFVKTHTDFYAMGLCAGTILGPTQAASRSLLARFTPPSKSAAFFGFFSLTGKVSAALGPLLYGEVVRITGSQQWATLSLAPFFLIGLIILQAVHEKNETQETEIGQ